ncbi:MAG: DUF805 domain-containing protein [Lachnospiraceae bacterium]|nr:DUF805 domain-containing protein [Lachnospiraceae bacterium]
MELVNIYVGVLKNYVGFSGRARRREYWMFVLANAIITMILGFIVRATHITAISTIYSLAILLPSLAVAVRRLHDMGKSGWWYLICLVPVAGIFILIYFLCQDSQEGTNEYGPNPKELGAKEYTEF